MTLDERPIDGGRWGKWVQDGSERWDVVQRSWNVFALNTTDLVGLLNIPATNIAQSLLLMGDDRQAAAPFWAALDQRLHNQLASAVSLVEHTRRLVTFYGDDAPKMVAEFTARNATVADLEGSVFLRDLRNYLVHYGLAPIVQSLSLGPSDGSGSTGHSVKLSAVGLLGWAKWRAISREYLARFPDRDGPVLIEVVVEYANEMSGLYTWLLQQRAVVMRTDNAPDRFRMEAP